MYSGIQTYKKLNKPYTPEDVAFIRNQYLSISDRQIALLLMRTEISIKSKRWELGLVRCLRSRERRKTNEEAERKHRMTCIENEISSLSLIIHIKRFSPLMVQAARLRMKELFTCYHYLLDI